MQQAPEHIKEKIQITDYDNLIKLPLLTVENTTTTSLLSLKEILTAKNIELAKEKNSMISKKFRFSRNNFFFFNVQRQKIKETNILNKIDSAISNFTSKNNNEMKNSMHAIDKLENKGFKLNPLLYLTNNEQSLLEEITLQYEKMVKENNQSRIIKDSCKENFQVFTNDCEYAKISREGRTFPLKIKVLSYSGDYEIYVSNKTEHPTIFMHDYLFRRDEKNLVISFPEMKYNWIYIAIYGKVFSTLVLEARFNGKINTSNPERKLNSMDQVKVKGWKKGLNQKIPIMSQDAKLLFGEIEEIKKKRKKKMMKLAHDRDIVKSNIDLADNFEKIKLEQSMNNKIVQKIKGERALEKKELIDDFDNQKKIINIIKRDIKMKEKVEEEKRKILLFRQYRWLQSIYLILLARQFYDEINGGRLKRIQEIYKKNFCRKIQRFMKRYIEKKNETFYKDERIIIDCNKAIKMYALHNISELKKRVKNIIPNFLKQTKVYFEFTNQFEIFLKRMIKIQRFYRVSQKNKIFLVEKLYQRECHKMIDIDVKQTKFREKNQTNENGEADLKIPSGHTQVSLADCIRNIKSTQKEKILIDYLSILNLKYQERYRKYKKELAKLEEDQKRKKEEEYQKLIDDEINELQIQEESKINILTEHLSKSEPNILITQPEDSSKLKKIGSVLSEKPEKILHFIDVAERIKQKEYMPQKPIFNVFQKADLLHETIKEAIDKVKIEKKWVVL